MYQCGGEDMKNKESILIQAGKAIRKLRNLSVHKVAKATHISGGYLSEIENGLKEPSDAVLESLADYYQVEKSELFSLYGKIAPAEATLLLDNPAFRKTIIQMSTDDRLTKEERDSIALALAELYQNMTEERE